MGEPKTRNVARRLYVNYLKRADECLATAKGAFVAQQWNASAINAIHSAIAGVDALCVYYLGKRHAGESHGGAIKLFNSFYVAPQELQVNAKRLSRMLGMKNMAEYEERLVFKSEAEKALKDAERLLAFVLSKLP